jgi:hypothetical protein
LAKREAPRAIRFDLMLLLRFVEGSLSDDGGRV